MLEDDIYLIPVRIEECDVPERLRDFHWVDLFEHGGFERLVKALKIGMERLGLGPPIQLRAKPLDKLEIREVERMLYQKDFYCLDFNIRGNGLRNMFDFVKRDKEKVIVDHITGLTWQQAASKDKLTSKDAASYIQRLNSEKYAGYNDWRLPTLEEAMSLMEKKTKNGLHISPIFDLNFTGWEGMGRYIWTADKGHHKCWMVDFLDGCCCFNLTPSRKFHVLAVR